MSRLRLPIGEYWDILKATYPTASQDQIKFWANYYGYKDVDSFTRQMRERGVFRVKQKPEVTDCNLKMDSWRNHPDGITDSIDMAQPLDTGWQASDINIPLKIETNHGTRTVAFICDTHNPYQDRKVVELVRQFLKEKQPDYVILGGDMCDFYQISKFDKNPERKNRLQEDLDDTKTMLKQFRDDMPNAKFYYTEGNHEDRLRVTLWTKAEEFASLRALKLESLLGLTDYDITLVPYEKGLMINEIFLVLHGDISSVNSGWTAKRLYEKHGGCGIAGHCHRQGSFLKKNRFGIYGWWEGGCLCHLNPDYIANPNWMNGFSLITFIGHRFFVESIPIIDGKFIFGSRLYE